MFGEARMVGTNGSRDTARVSGVCPEMVSVEVGRGASNPRGLDGRGSGPE